MSQPDVVTLTPEGERLAVDIEALAQIVEGATGGWTRRVFSDAYRAAREFVCDRMRDAGLEASIDAAGNVVGRLPGRDPGAPPLVTGSHTDTVNGAGRFDGMVGVLGAIESVRVLRERGVSLHHDLLVMDFLGEEANPFGLSCIGSRAITGLLAPHHLDFVDPHTGQSLGAAMRDYGLDPDAALRIARAPGSIASYIELHIEQGPLLEQRGAQIGAVTAIAGIDRVLMRFAGRADHAGTMPMKDRHDALLAAAEAMLQVERVACGAPIHGVGTSGRLESEPGAPNVVPGSATVWSEIRSTDPVWLGMAQRQLVADIADIAAKRGVEVDTTVSSDQPPATAAQAMQDRVAAAADALGFCWAAVPSGAGHDAAHLAHLGPMGMIFVPSVAGRSHVPEEYTDINDIVRGVHTLTATILAGDAS